jgi:hypothetical protein
MNSDVVSLVCITQAIQAEPIIVFFEEAGVSIIATLNNMTGYARQIHPWFSWHRNFLFLSIYDIFIIVRDSHVPPPPLTLGMAKGKIAYNAELASTFSK